MGKPKTISRHLQDKLSLGWCNIGERDLQQYGSNWEANAQYMK